MKLLRQSCKHKQIKCDTPRTHAHGGYHRRSLTSCAHIGAVTTAPLSYGPCTVLKIRLPKKTMSDCVFFCVCVWVTFRIVEKLEFQCIGNGFQNHQSCPGFIQDTLIVLPPYMHIFHHQISQTYSPKNKYRSLLNYVATIFCKHYVIT